MHAYRVGFITSSTINQSDRLTAGRYQWMATREILTSLSYNNWDTGHPKPGYVYMDASYGKWKTEYSASERITLCVELERSE